DSPLPRRGAPTDLDTTALPVAEFDDGDQHHHGGRALRVHLISAGLAAAAAAAGIAVGPLLAAPFAVPAALTM
ncbi:hypothetical protein, partial [Mycobacterium avium]